MADTGDKSLRARRAATRSHHLAAQVSRARSQGALVAMVRVQMAALLFLLAIHVRPVEAVESAGKQPGGSCR